MLASAAALLWKDFPAMSAPLDGLLHAAVALAPAAVLRLLADLAGAAERPEVSVHLSGVQVLGGVPVRVGADEGARVVVLADQHTGRLGYVLLASVVAVEVPAPQRYQDVLTGVG